MAKHIVTGLWDCPHCTEVRISGTTRDCPQCHVARGADVQFYLPSDVQVGSTWRSSSHAKPKTTDEQVAVDGPDVVCSACQALNPHGHEFCRVCKNLLIAGHEPYRFAPDTDTAQEAHQASRAERQRRMGDAQRNAHGVDKPRVAVAWRKFIWWGLGAVAVAGVILAIVLAVRPVVDLVTVEQVSWRSEMDIQQYRTVRESGWDVPPGGRIIDSERAIKGYRQVVDHIREVPRQVPREVPDGYETVTKTREVPERRQTGTQEVVTGTRNLGNGQFEVETRSEPVYETVYRTETYTDREPKYRTVYDTVIEKVPVYRDDPIYATRYTWDVDTWKHETTLVASGSNHRLTWPATPWPVSGQSHIGERRIADRRSSGRITAIIANDTERVSWSTDAAQLPPPGMILRITRRMGSVVDAVPVSPE